MEVARTQNKSEVNEVFQASRKPFEAALDALDRDTALNTKGADQAQITAATYSGALWWTGLLCCARFWWALRASSTSS